MSNVTQIILRALQLECESCSFRAWQSMPELTKKRDWQLSPSAFRELLRWLDQGTDSEGQTFLEMRGRLVAYFDR